MNILSHSAVPTMHVMPCSSEEASKHAVYIFCPEDGDIRFLQNILPLFQTTWHHISYDHDLYVTGSRGCQGIRRHFQGGSMDTML